MLKHLKLVVIFLLIPGICYFSLDNSLSKWHEEWLEVVRQRVAEERVADFALTRLCSDAKFRNQYDLNPVCQPYENSTTLRWVAVGTAAATVLFAFIIIVAGRLCKAKRLLLLRIFRPGLILSNVFVALLMVVQAALLSGWYLYAINDGKTDGNFVFYAVLFSIAALFGAFFTIRPLFGRSRAEAVVVGRALSANEYPKLWALVRGLANRVGTDMPEHIIAGLTPTFFVTEADVRCLDGALKGRSLYLSLPLCRIMTISELSSVICHELGHFKGEDTAFSLHFYPIYRGAVDAVQGVSVTADKIAKYTNAIPIRGMGLIGLLVSLTLLPSIYMLNFFLEAFAAAENGISRERELAADAVAAGAEGAPNIASALVKVVAFTDVWQVVVSEMNTALQEGSIEIRGELYDAEDVFSNVCAIFASFAGSHAESNPLDGLDAKQIPHPTDSHPPLSTRLSALGISLAQIAPIALRLNVERPASVLSNK